MRWSISLVVATGLVLWLGCEAGWSAGKPKPQAGKTPGAPAAVAAAGPAQGAAAQGGSAQAVMAVVNGKPVAIDRLHELLVGAYGMPIAQQLVASELARQAAGQKGISVTEDEIRAEHDLTLRETFPQAQTLEQQERLLDQLLMQRNMGRNLWQVIMERNALLRKLVGHSFEVSESELKMEFARRYDRKVVIRHIEVASSEEAQKVRELADKEDFAQLAVKRSINNSRTSGGLLPPFGASEAAVPPSLRQTALAMKKPGDISQPVQTGATFHILRLEKIEEPQNASFAAVKDTLAASLREQHARIAVNELLAKLVSQAKIEYVDKQLKDQADKAAKAAAAAATRE